MNPANQNRVRENSSRHQVFGRRHGFIQNPYEDNGRHAPHEFDGIPTITEFVPPSPTDTPRKLFIGSRRFIRRTNAQEILIYTDGACFGNGLSNPQAGCGFVISPQQKVKFRLENRGPTGEAYPQTSNRAELRAVIAALESRPWQGDDMGPWSRLVIATDSEYVVFGITHWIYEWIRRGWRTSAGQPVKNQDLWKRLVHLIKRLNMPLSYTHPPHGIAISFWRIPREWNEEADWEAKKGAQLEESQEYISINGGFI
ncbi:hypothetical protein MFRU_043g00150 [Monilinia fructicola]|nr:hypothetical protein MFRU_043g00150 [Monilinia fructicola]